MPVAYKIYANLGLIFFAGLDTNVAEMLQAEKEASTDPLRLSNMRIVIDLSQTQLDINLADIYAAINMNRQRMEKSLELESTAIISHSRFAKTMGDTYRLLGENLPLRFGIFSTLPDAVKWLGLSDKEADIVEIQKELLEKLRR